MSIQFSRSIRALHVDSFQASRVGLILACLVAIAFLIWFIFARITLYESSDKIRFDIQGYIEADFPPEAISRIQIGQPAILRITINTDQSLVSIPSLVIDRDIDNGQARLIRMKDTLPEYFLESQLNGQIEVEVEHIQPVKLLLRSYNKRLANTQIPLSPQSNQDWQK
jgi:hypothetical protein